MGVYICAAPHSPRRQKLNLRMKSLSLDSPESTEQARRGRGAGGSSHGVASCGPGSLGAVAGGPHSSHSSSSRIQCTLILCLRLLTFAPQEFSHSRRTFISNLYQWESRRA